ncbi:ABC transporter ATP-binding protein [bacterium]|nr:MAG: ABC transporter ATP-binding protein [bacterium]
MLSVRDLNVAYGDFIALHGVSLDVDEGEIVVIVGANGAGKTTTMNSIAGILHVRSGEILLDGEHLERKSPREIVERGLVLVPEGRHLFPEMTIQENLLVGGQAARSRRNLRVNLAAMEERFPILGQRRSQAAGTLSGGEQQMLAIARALMSEPRILLMDEPSIGLSPLLTARIFAMVQEINAMGITVVLVEQNVVQSLELATRAYVIAEGRVVLQGGAAEIRGHADVKRAYLGEA